MESPGPLREVDVPVRDPGRLAPLVGSRRYAELLEQAGRTRSAMHGGTVWNVNSTAVGGGVAEMLQELVGYGLGLGLAVRWLVAGGEPAFFTVTKRLHNNLHGAAGDGGGFGAAEARAYEATSAASAAGLGKWVRPGDVVILHDPQTAALAEACKAAGAVVIWRCHIGTDTPNRLSEQAWTFLQPYLAPCDAYVFTRRQYAPSWVPPERMVMITPSIDPFSPKNYDLTEPTCRDVLGAVGLWNRGAPEPVSFTRRDGSTGQVLHTGTVVGDGSLDPAKPLVVQVSRWDRLKDMQGVLSGFAEYVPASVDAQLALVGPDVSQVGDDPEGCAVLEQCTDAWSALPSDRRRRIRLVTLPEVDVDENAVMVNAIQRQASVVVQKSLAEGFGLTVTEAMWKARPVVASAVGGITDQMPPGTGELLHDPTDLQTFGAVLGGLLARPDEQARLGQNAHRHVTQRFLGDVHLTRLGMLVEALKGGDGAGDGPRDDTFGAGPRYRGET